MPLSPESWVQPDSPQAASTPAAQKDKTEAGSAALQVQAACGHRDAACMHTTPAGAWCAAAGVGIAHKCPARGKVLTGSIETPWRFCSSVPQGRAQSLWPSAVQVMLRMLQCSAGDDAHAGVGRSAIRIRRGQPLCKLRYSFLPVMHQHSLCQAV